MKPIDAQFGFWLLVGCGVGAFLASETVAGAVFMVGAMLFNAVKTIEQKLTKND